LGVVEILTAPEWDWYSVISCADDEKGTGYLSQEGARLLTVHRYIERNPVRAGLVERAQDWLWSSAAAAQENQPVLDPGRVPVPSQ
jgi:hypothetical protein